MKIFAPILAGATLRDRAIACLGALFGIAATGLLSRAIMGADLDLALLLAAPLGASAVLVFAVPASPMAQPWPVIGGNIVSALSGVVAAHLIPEPMIAAGAAVALSIIAMSVTRSLHPAGGGSALVAALGGPAFASHGWMFAFLPVGLNAVLVVATGWLFHRFTRHAYPHRAGTGAPPAPLSPPPITEADIEAALKTFGEPLDVSAADLQTIANLAAASAHRRP
jgi:CBS domain-containing membrane protein